MGSDTARKAAALRALALVKKRTGRKPAPVALTTITAKVLAAVYIERRQSQDPAWVPTRGVTSATMKAARSLNAIGVRPILFAAYVESVFEWYGRMTYKKYGRNLPAPASTLAYDYSIENFRSHLGPPKFDREALLKTAKAHGLPESACSDIAAYAAVDLRGEGESRPRLSPAGEAAVAQVRESYGRYVYYDELAATPEPKRKSS